MKIKNIFCPICHCRTYFTGKVVYESKRTRVIEWKCADCGVVLKSRHDKLGEWYFRRMKTGKISLRPKFWIRKGYYRDFLFFEIKKKLYSFRFVDVERLQKDEILAVPVYLVIEGSG